MGEGSPRPPFLPYGRQSISDEDVAAVAAALRSEHLTTGPLVDRFELAFAAAVGAAEAVVCINGTAALHLAAMAAGVGRGDVVIAPSITFVATANASRYLGAEVVFADVDPDTALMTPETLADALERAARRHSGRTVRAVFPVHMGGNVCEVPALRLLADAAGAEIVEDACHALGTLTPWGKVGACRSSLMSTFSFHPVKTIATGEGGAITTNDMRLAKRMRRLRAHGIQRDPKAFTAAGAFDGAEPNPWWYEQVELGFNYRLPDVLCALGLSQLSRLDAFAERRRRLAALYREELRSLAPVVRTVEPTEGTTPCPHLFTVLIDFEAAGLTRRECMERLRARGIGTQVHYIPVHRQPYWRARDPELSLPGADSWHARVLSLPLFPDMADDDPERVADALREVLALDVRRFPAAGARP